MPAAVQRRPGVVLVGFMGAGKTAVGRELAERLELPFADSDALIEAEAGPIAEIFAASGERGFRALEARVVLANLAALGAEPKVLALGGGAVLSQAVRRALRATQPVVWLTAPPEELWRRVVAEGLGIRPLAQDGAAFRDLLARREALYREVATLVVDGTGRTPADVATEIVADLSGGGHASGVDSKRRAEGAA